MATHSSILVWEILWMRSLVGYSPWGRKESDVNNSNNFPILFKIIFQVMLFSVFFNATSKNLFHS